MKRNRLLPCLAGLLVLVACSAQARVREEQLDVPVRVVDGYGKVFEQSIKVTVFRDDQRESPSPVLILNHGRAPDAAGRVELGRARYTEASKYFVQRGFVVAVPTRVGYGVSGGEDIEDSGSCNKKNYAPGYSAAAQQTLAVLAVMRERPDALKDRAVVAGQSYGGATAITVAALNVPGVQATINFAGGGGGNPVTQPQNPCAAHLLEKLFKTYGETARIPTLWFYAENDMYFGPTLPKKWFDAYVGAGGKAEFVPFPAQPENGHLLFTRHPELWQPRVDAFLDSVGFAAPIPKGN